MSGVDTVRFASPRSGVLSVVLSALRYPGPRSGYLLDLISILQHRGNRYAARGIADPTSYREDPATRLELYCDFNQRTISSWTEAYTASCGPLLLGTFSE